MYTLVKVGKGKHSIDMGENILGYTEHIAGVWVTKIGDYRYESTNRKTSVEGCMKKILCIHANLPISG